MAAMQNFLQSTGFYLFSQGENWKCLLMIAIACVLLYLGIRKKFEPLLLVPIAFGMLLTNLPGAEMFHEILFAGTGASRSSTGSSAPICRSPPSTTAPSPSFSTPTASSETAGMPAKM